MQMRRLLSLILRYLQYVTQIVSSVFCKAELKVKEDQGSIREHLIITRYNAERAAANEMMDIETISNDILKVPLLGSSLRVIRYLKRLTMVNRLFIIPTQSQANVMMILSPVS